MKDIYLYLYLYLESQWCLVAELAEVGTLSSFITNTCAMVAGNNSSPGLDSGCGSSPNPKELLTQFIHSLRGIACGMQYLFDIGYVHKVCNYLSTKLVYNRGYSMNRYFLLLVVWNRYPLIHNFLNSYSQ